MIRHFLKCLLLSPIIGAYLNSDYLYSTYLNLVYFCSELLIGIIQAVIYLWPLWIMITVRIKLYKTR